MLAIHAVKTGVPAVPSQVDGAGLAVAVLGDDALGNVVLFGILVVIVVAVEKEHDVRVLLDGAGFTQIREHRALILARFVGTRELRQADDRNVELLGHDLEHTAHVGNRLRAALVRPAVTAAGRLHELQVVNDDEAEVRDATAATTIRWALWSRARAGR